MPRVAVIHQAIDSPTINGLQKPKKPNGYKDSCADIAYALKSKHIAGVITPSPNPEPSRDEDWSFPDTEEGLLAACRAGADIIWANTVLFSSHPLQQSSALGEYVDRVRIVGQSPQLHEQVDDKAETNDLLRATGKFTMPRAWTIDATRTTASDFLEITGLPYPIVCKPVRGRGSHGVKVCRAPAELQAHMQSLFAESPVIMLEEYLAGQEGTITIMPPSNEQSMYWAMPIVLRFNHADGVAPYNGIVAVTANSKAVSIEEMKQNEAYSTIAAQCVEVAEILRATAPMRIDVRCFEEGKEEFALFDVNMKPNMTGPGRPGREDQASLTAMAAESLGWDYPTLLDKILECAQPLAKLRSDSFA